MNKVFCFGFDKQCKYISEYYGYTKLQKLPTLLESSKQLELIQIEKKRKQDIIDAPIIAKEMRIKAERDE